MCSCRGPDRWMVLCSCPRCERETSSAEYDGCGGEVGVAEQRNDQRRGILGPVRRRMVWRKRISYIQSRSTYSSFSSSPVASAIKAMRYQSHVPSKLCTVKVCAIKVSAVKAGLYFAGGE